LYVLVCTNQPPHPAKGVMQSGHPSCCAALVHHWICPQTVRGPGECQGRTFRKGGPSARRAASTNSARSLWSASRAAACACTSGSESALVTPLWMACSSALRLRATRCTPSSPQTKGRLGACAVASDTLSRHGRASQRTQREPHARTQKTATGAGPRTRPAHACCPRSGPPAVQTPR